MRSTPDEEVEAIIQDVQVAFLGVRSGRITLHEAEVIDDYGSDKQRAKARNRDTECCWEDIRDDDVEECTSALCHVDPESWRYYIAPYMIWSLRCFRTNSSIVSDYTIYTFDLSCHDSRLREYKIERFRQLNDEQSCVVCRFLRYMAKNGDFADDHAANEALRKYWGKFCDDYCT